MNSTGKKLKNYRSALVVLTITFCVFVLVYEKNHARKGEERFRKHARIVADDLWNFNTVGISEYLRLAAESDHYERLTVVDHGGEVYQEVENTARSRAESLGTRLRLIPRVNLVSPIEYEQKYIGWIEGVWIPQTLFIHFSVFCFHALIFLVILLYQRTKNENVLLENRVEERTDELSRSNEQLKNEIKDRSAVEKALKRYKHIVSSTEDLMSFVDTRYVYLAVNDAYLKAYDKSLDQIVGHTVEELFGRDVFHQKLKQYLDTTFSGNTVKFQGWFHYPALGRRYMDVTYHPFRDEHNEISGMVSTVHDLTSSYQAEHALRESEEKFRSLVENINDVIYSLDERGRFSYISPPFISWTGFAKDEVLGKRMLNFIDDDDRERVRRWVESDHPAPLQDQEFRLLTLKGETLWVRSSSSPKVEEGKREGLRGTLTNINERKKLEVQLLQAQKLESVGTLAGGIAHDFNNLLTGIQGYVSLLQLECSGKSPAPEYLGNIESYVRSGASLTNQLLGFARGGKYEVRPTNLNELIQKSSEIFARTRKNITLVKNLAGDLWIVDVDEQQIEQVLINLYLNGWQAMPDGGTLTITSENFTQKQADQAEAAFVSGEYVKITVGDDGIGMDEEVMQRVFDPFFTTKELSRGTGLGLASSYGIVRNHGGDIKVSSQKGQGTAISVFLPASHGNVEKESVQTAGMLKGEESVLIIDDEQLVLEVGSELLLSLGYRVETAKSGHEALQKLSAGVVKPDLIVLDMIMPEMGGGEVFDKVKQILPDVRVLLSSGYSLDGQAQAILSKGCDGFIQKPFSLVELSQKLRTILDAKYS